MDTPGAARLVAGLSIPAVVQRSHEAGASPELRALDRPLPRNATTRGASNALRLYPINEPPRDVTAWSKCPGGSDGNRNEEDGYAEPKDCEIASTANVLCAEGDLATCRCFEHGWRSVGPSNSSCRSSSVNLRSWAGSFQRGNTFTRSVG